MITTLGATPYQASSAAPAARVLLSAGGSRASEAAQYTSTIDRLQAHVADINAQESSCRSELEARRAVLGKAQKALGFVMPGVLTGAALAVAGGVLNTFCPGVAPIVTVALGSVIMAGSGMVGVNARMKVDEGVIVCNVMPARLSIFESARNHAQDLISETQAKLAALRAEEQKLLEQAHEQINAVPGPGGTIMMEPEQVFIGGLAVPRRAA